MPARWLPLVTIMSGAGDRALLLVIGLLLVFLPLLALLLIGASRSPGFLPAALAVAAIYLAGLALLIFAWFRWRHRPRERTATVI